MGRLRGAPRAQRGAAPRAGAAGRGSRRRSRRGDAWTPRSAASATTSRRAWTRRRSRRPASTPSRHLLDLADGLADHAGPGRRSCARSSRTACGRSTGSASCPTSRTPASTWSTWARAACRSRSPATSRATTSDPAAIRGALTAHIAAQLAQPGRGRGGRGGRRGSHRRVRGAAGGRLLAAREAARRDAHAEPRRDGRPRRADAALRARRLRAVAGRHPAHGVRGQPGLLPRAGRDPGGHARSRRIRAYLRWHALKTYASALPDAVRGRGVRVLRPHPGRPAGAAAALEARPRGRRRGHRRDRSRSASWRRRSRPRRRTAASR